MLNKTGEQSEPAQLWQHRGIHRRTLIRSFILLGLLLFALFGMIMSIAKGSTQIPFSSLWSTFFSAVESDATHGIIWNIRLPRTLVAALVGCNLAVAGALLQGIMKNPLADPQIIGVNSGAGLVAVTILILYPNHSHLVTPAAFAGALLAAVLVYFLAWKDGIRPARIILAGVAVAALLGAGISGLLVFYSDRVHGALTFIVGGLNARSWPHFYSLLPYSLIGLSLAWLGAKRCNILLLGDENARGLGIRVQWTRLGLSAIAALLAASAVSVVGMLGFVGLIVPHAARMLIGNDYRILIPASALLGMAVVTLSDMTARVWFAPAELPVGIMMAVLGAPFFLYLLRRD